MLSGALTYNAAVPSPLLYQPNQRLAQLSVNIIEIAIGYLGCKLIMKAKE